MELREFFEQHPKVAVAFSGGTDSAFLLYSARKYGSDVRAYFVKTQFQPDFELADARKLAEELGVPLTVITVDVFTNPDVIKNDKLRCYHCKQANFSAILEHAKKDGYELLLDGTNASDDPSDRPGMRALAELGVRSPLRECGLDKDEIRRLSRKAGLFTSDKPSYSCLATRIPTDTAIDARSLQHVEASETALHNLGLSDLRVRKMGKTAKIQLPAEQMQRAVEMHSEIVKELSPYFESILLDLVPRKSSITSN
ncbi:MAG TPA: ATP-dependent sacrificial sulfur transferase LarE [Clostridiales bacterium]|jgi:uncharacterized protein|nr:ATP-dependent sacrificial sulfur transferase LarE [Clostridiales bacterium]